LTESASIFGLLRNFGTAVGVSVTTTMLARMTQTNHAVLTEHVTRYNHALESQAPSLVAAGVPMAAMLDAEITRQASMIAYLNLYRELAYFSASMALLLFLVRTPKKALEPDQSLAVEA
jgi:DHA2 family multidrug resistance protein